MLEVDHEQLRYWIKRHYEVRLNSLPMFIWGAPGIGKTYGVRDASKDIAQAMNMEYSTSPKDFAGNPKKFILRTVNAAQFDPSDIKGIPFAVDGYTRWLVPDDFPRCGQGIYFLDEFNRAPDLVRSSFYSLLHGRHVANAILPDGWMVIAAGNRVEDRVNVFDMEATLGNRYAHYLLKTPDSPDDTESWIQHFAIPNELDFRIIGFLQWKQLELNKYDPKNKSDAAFPTPRTWEKLSYLIKGQDNVICSKALIGRTSGHLFEQFCKSLNKYDVDKIIMGNQDFNDLKPDEKYIVVTAISEWYGKKSDRLKKITKFLKGIEPEYGMLLMNLLKAFGAADFREQMWEIVKTDREIGLKYAKFIG